MIQWLRQAASATDSAVPTRTLRTLAYYVLLPIALFWVSLALSERLAQPNLSDAPTQVDLYLPEGRLDYRWTPSPDEEAIKVGLSKDGSFYTYFDSEKHQGGYFVLDFELQEIPRQLTLFLGSERQIIGVKLNNELLYSYAADRSFSPRGGFEPAIYVLPRGLLKEGKNQIIIGQGGVYWKKLPRFSIAPGGDVIRAYEWGQALSVHLVGAGIALLLVVSAIYAVINWPRQERRIAGSFIGLMITWAAYNMYASYLPFHIENPWREIIGYCLLFALVTAFACVAAVWANIATRFQGALLLAGITVIVGIAALGFVVPDGEALGVIAGPTESVAKLVIAPIIFFAIAFKTHNRPGPGPIARGAVLVCLCAIIMEGLDGTFLPHVPFLSDTPIIHPIIPRFAGVLALGLVASVAAEATRARTIISHHADILQKRLTERERELRQALDRESETLVRETMIAERERIMRDMHDGLGGRLTILAAQADSGKSSQERLAGGLRDALHELRLIVDSLDTAGDALATALGAFRSRIETSLTQSGISLDWQIDPIVKDVRLPPNHVLHVFRILQEAVSNAIHHGNPDTIGIRLIPSTDGRVSIEIDDNGSGINHEAPAGRGLRNMQRRAKEIGAALQIDQNPRGSGVLVTLSLETQDTEEAVA